MADTPKTIHRISEYHMPPPDHPTPPRSVHVRRTDPNIDPALYQILYEVERRFEEKFEVARARIMEDMKALLAPVHTRFDGMAERFDSVDGRLDEGNTRFSAHSDKIEKAKRVAEEARQAVNSPLEKKTSTAEKPKDGWVIKFGEKVLLPVTIAALSTLASLWVLVQIKLIAVADTTTNQPVATQPQVSNPAPPQPPAQPQTQAQP